MTHSNSLPEEYALPLPLTQRALSLAEHFARQQPTPQKAQQVRLNTLAICAMHDYLQLMGIATDPTTGDSWNPAVQLGADVADLEIPGVGRLECRPVQSLTACPVPAEVWQDRIGYAVVQIDEMNRAANLLGFVETAAVEELPLSQLHPPEALLDHLDRLLHPAAQIVTEKLSHLSQWLQNQFESGWHSVESLLNPPELSPAYAFRSPQETAMPEPIQAAVSRARRLQLSGSTIDTAVALVVDLMPSEPPSGPVIEIRLQIHPVDEQLYLPENLHLTILDGTGAVFLETRARARDNYIQLQFRGRPGEQFSVQIGLEDAVAGESFVI